MGDISLLVDFKDTDIKSATWNEGIILNTCHTSYLYLSIPEIEKLLYEAKKAALKQLLDGENNDINKQWL